MSVKDNNYKPKPTHPPHKIRGTILRIFIPAGAVINILNLIEVSSPEGISLVIRVPFLKGSTKLTAIIDSIIGAGGKVEIVEEEIVKE